MVEVKLNSCRIISHYCKNIFALHIHTSIISTLMFNTFNIIIHQNTKFMVISYNLNLHFRIHCKKILKTRLKFISSYYDTTKKTHNNINIEFTAKVYASLYY